MKMLIVAMLTVVAAFAAQAKTRTNVEVIDGVVYQCTIAMRKYMVQEFTKEVAAYPEAKEEVANFKKFLQESLVDGCRHREAPENEDLTFCDGSACYGASAVFKNGRCEVSDYWSGQDDQDGSGDKAESCLMDFDFKK
ncbi:hypothetical protein QJS83_07045 [Bdellovibrio sp. 22V]|uniref:hypothetical protein n=1 Tax=Bdellovibrio sp. 22V TaxID=3044166 RepID=UPI002543BED0|nr:hypothetical protein [Bdellovibrio sp. 22V]WII73628.1 hypothetical protein QJS83_07045 [Bdellovibrio sp. 22V]